MKKVYEGKTKDVYALDNGNVMLKFNAAYCFSMHVPL